MMLDRVTITGADDSVAPEDVLALSKEFPYVEWGVLFSQTKQGTPRFPTEGWIRAFSYLAKEAKASLSAHLCGRWLRDLVIEGDFAWLPRFGAAGAFSRVQLNFHGQFHRACDRFHSVLREHGRIDWIFQHDGVNDSLMAKYAGQEGLGVYPLFDRSHGAGLVPLAWPRPIGPYCGYAGGLGPDNIVKEIGKIGHAAGDSRVWIDMETRVRSDDDGRFEIDKVRRCLEAARPFVEGPR